MMTVNKCMIDRNNALNILLAERNCEYLAHLAYVHKLTKHYLLIAEEVAPDGTIFLQPLKEHRDAYEHLSRIFASIFQDESSVPMVTEDYVTENLKKAFGHEYRAFFDTADWLTFTCRKYIRETLSIPAVRKRYSEQFDFQSTQEFINEVPFTIARYREMKDISNETPLVSEVDAYKEVLDRLIEIYGDVQRVEY